MSYLSELGLLALGSRSKALSERLYGLADRIYRGRDLPLQGRWLPVLRLLADRGPHTVGDIASEIGQSHAAVSQLADKLVSDGWLVATADARDGRRRVLAVTVKTEQAIRDAVPVWRELRELLEQRCEQAGIDLLGTFERFERVLDEPIADQVIARCVAREREPVRIAGYDVRWRDDFRRLNEAWLEKYFSIEDIDRHVLSNPESEILDDGGVILFALRGEQAVGTCALKRQGPGRYELTKMAVDEGHQGLGLGRRLIDAAIAEFQRLRGRTLYLETNDRLAPALALYRSSGFEQQPTGMPGSKYQRSNVYMIWRGQAGVASGRVSKGRKSVSSKKIAKHRSARP